METRGIGIDDLNNQCLSLIFKFLTIPDRLISAQVCQRWRTIEHLFSNDVETLDTSDPNWALIFDRITNEEEFIKIIETIFNKYGKHIKKLKYDKNTNYPIGHIFPFQCMKQTFPNIKNIIWLTHTPAVDVAQMMRKCKGIVEFRCDVDLRSNTMELLIKNNKNLKYLQITAIDRWQKYTLKTPKNVILQELDVTFVSQNVLDYVTSVVSNSKSTLKILRFICQGKFELNRFIIELSQCSQLEKLKIPVEGYHDFVLESLSQLDHLIELDLQSDKTVDDEFLLRLALQSKTLKSLNISDCKNVTDEGLINLSKLKEIETLHINGIKIQGYGLNDYKKLKFLSCRGSNVFDKPLYHVLRSCRQFEHLDVSNNTSITVNTIETAIRMIKSRDNRISLKMIVDYQLILANKVELPSLLELFGRKYSKYDDRDILYQNSCTILVESTYHLEEIVMFMDNQFNHDTTNLNYDCMAHILHFLPVSKRILMKRVSNDWNWLISSTWGSVKILDLSTPDWKSIALKLKSDQLDDILDKVFTISGRYLKLVKIEDTSEIQCIAKHCSRLGAIIIFDETFLDTDIMALASSCHNLTKLSMVYSFTEDNALGQLFQSNRKLKSITLYNVSGSAFDSLLQLNVNVLIKLRLYNVHLNSNQRQALNNFSRALSHSVNLEELLVLPGEVHSQHIIDIIRDCKNLKTLILQHKSQEHIEGNFNSLYNLKCLQTLAVRECLQVTDEFLFELMDRCRALIHIDITGCENVTDEGLQTISLLQNLHTLVMENLSKIEGTGLSSFSGKSFKHLECQLCTRIRSDSLCDLLNNCPNLEFLNITQCCRLDQSVVETALRVTSHRVNGVKLKLIADLHLIRSNRGMAPPSLQIITCTNV